MANIVYLKGRVASAKAWVEDRRKNLDQAKANLLNATDLNRNRCEGALSLWQGRLNKAVTSLQNYEEELRQAQFSDEDMAKYNLWVGYEAAALPLIKDRGLPDYDSNGGGEDHPDGNGDGNGFLSYINPSPQTHIPTIIQKPPKPIIPTDEAYPSYIDPRLPDPVNDLKNSVIAKVDQRQQEKDGFITPVGQLISIEAFRKPPVIDSVIGDPVKQTKAVFAKQTQTRTYASNPVMLVFVLAGLYLLMR